MGTEQDILSLSCCNEQGDRAAKLLRGLIISICKQAEIRSMTKTSERKDT